MPKILETDIGEIEFPDEFTPEQIQSWAASELPRIRKGLQRGPIAETPARLGRDWANVATDIIQGGAQGAQIFDEALNRATAKRLGLQAAMFAPPGRAKAAAASGDLAAEDLRRQQDETREQRLQESALYQMGQDTKGAAREFYAVNPQFEDTPRAKISQGLSSAAGILASGIAGRVARPILGMASYGALVGQQGAEEAVESGHPDKADEAFLSYAGLGVLLEASIGFPMRILRLIRAARKVEVPAKEFGKAFRQTLKDKAKTVGKKIGQGVGREGAQEPLEQTGQNIVARVLEIDPDRPLTQGAAEAALYGGIVGGILSVPVGVQQARDSAPENKLGRLLQQYGLDSRAFDAISPAIVESEAQRGGDPVRGQTLDDLNAPARRAREDADRAMMPQPPAPPVQPSVSPDIGFQPLPDQRPIVAPVIEPEPEPVNRQDLVSIAGDVIQRFSAREADIPARARARLPVLRRLFERLKSDPENPTILADLAGLLELQYDPGAARFPTLYRQVEGGRLSRRPPQPTAAPSRRRAPNAQQDTTTTPPSGQTPRGPVPAPEGGARVTEGGQPPTVPKPEVAEPDERVLHTFDNPDDGIRSLVSQHEQGFSVSLQDMDSGEFTGSVQIFPTEAEAVEFAKTVFTPKPEDAPQGREPEKKLEEEEREVAVVRRAREIANTFDDPKKAYQNLVNLYNQSRKFGTRTASSKAAQAYSTPPPLAYLADLLADVRSGRRIGEPTAGHGMLLIDASPDAQVFANELDPNRNQRMQNVMRLEPSMLDAASQDFFDYFSQVQPDRLVMNPPFGGRTTEEGKERFPIFNASTSKADTPSIDLAIALNTLETMTPDGKAAIIIGSKTGTMGPQFSQDPTQRANDYRRPEFLEFFKRFNVVDWFTVDGKLYEKMGAGWPVDVIVIDGKKPTLPSAQGGLPRPWTQPPQVFRSWEELEQKVEEANAKNNRAERGGSVGDEPSVGGGTPLPQGGGGRPGSGGRRPAGTSKPSQPHGTLPATPQTGRPPQSEPTPGTAPKPTVVRVGGQTPEGTGSQVEPPAGGGGQGPARPRDLGEGTPSLTSPAGDITQNLSPEDQAALKELHRRLREKLKQSGAGVDPETGLIGIQMTGLYVKAGIKTFAQYARQVKADLPDLWDSLKRYLHGYWTTEAGDNPDIEELTRAQAQTIINDIDNEVVAPEPPQEPPTPRSDQDDVGLNVKYKSVSKNADPGLVAPKNIADGMRRAVLRLEEDTGKTIDDFTAGELGWSKAELYKKLSAAQIEAVGLFIRNSKQRGTGLINSDQTGVGKGRTVASVVHWALKNGKTPIFVTQNKALYSDMAGRDLPSIGNTSFTPFVTDSQARYLNGKGEDVVLNRRAGDIREEMTNIASSGKLPKGVHGIFTTYYQLGNDKWPGAKETAQEKARRKKKFEPRPDGPRMAMLRALAPKAVFILDEVHSAAGKDSDVGLALQSILPNAAGVYYSSATFAKRPENLTIYALGTAMRLSGLSRVDLETTFQQGGVPLQQALTSMLAEEGEFVRRELNFDTDQGKVEFRFKATGIDPEQEEFLADTYTGFIRDIYPLVDQVNASASVFVDDGNQNKPEEAQVSLAPMSFGSRLFNLSNQYLFSIRSGAAASEAIAALRAGQKPFITVYNTMEGPISDLSTRNLPLDFRGLLEREMWKILEVRIKDPMTKGGKRVETFQPEDLPDGGAYFYRLRDQIRNTDFGGMPISPIDSIKKAVRDAGYSIGEITARKGEATEEDGEVEISPREKAERNKILGDYNNGELDALIVNGSASTGLSAHTDPSFKDQRQRHMIVAQPAPDINVFMQIIGRVMRFGQTKIPVYTFVSSALAAERRFMTMLRGKLTSLNANTSAETESGITEDLAEDIFNHIGDKVVFQVLMDNPEVAMRARIALPDEAIAPDDFARYATGHFILLPNSDAESLWSDIISIYRTTIKALTDAGENPMKADVQDLRAKIESSRTIESGTGKTAFDGPVKLERVTVKPPKPPLTFEQAQDLAAENEEQSQQIVEEWLGKFEQAKEDRLRTMREKGMDEDRIESTTNALQRALDAVQTAQRYLGTVVTAKLHPEAEPEFHAVPIALLLKSNQPTDFTSPNKHAIVLATNTLRQRVTIPLSQLESLQPVPESEFDVERESSGSRHIVSGNILRGFGSALSMAGTGKKPQVTIYSTSSGELRTGVLMPAKWNADTGITKIGKPVKTRAELQRLMDQGVTLRAGPILVQGRNVSVPSRNEFRNVWSERAFQDLFTQDPVQQRGEFRGELRQNGEQALLDYLVQQNLTLKYTPDLDASPEGLPHQDLTRVESGAPSQADTRYSAELASGDAGAMLRAIRSRSKSAGSRRLASRLEQLGVSPSVTLLTRDQIAKLYPNFKAANGVYSRDNNAIVIADDVVNQEKVFLHEMVHAATSAAISKGDPLARQLQRLFDLVDANPELSNQYGMTNLNEFVAEAFTNSEFQKAMSMASPAQNLWQRFVNTIRRLLGLSARDESYLDSVLRVGWELMSDERPEAGPPLASQDIFESAESLEEFVRKPTVSDESAQEIRTAGGAAAGLVSDAIYDQINSIDTGTTVGKRQASLLEFLRRLRALAPVQQIQAILQSNIPENVKDAAVSVILRNVEHVKAKTDEYRIGLEKAVKQIRQLSKTIGKYNRTEVEKQTAQQISANLLRGYREYLNAKAASLPANSNVAAEEQQLIARILQVVGRWEQSQDTIGRAILAIAKNVEKLPVDQGMPAVLRAIRDQNILRGTVGQEVIDFLTESMATGLSPVLESESVLEALNDLQSVQQKSDEYERQIADFEQVFAGEADPSPVELRQFAERYRSWRNRQAEASKVLRRFDKEYRQADEDFAVYNGAVDLLTQLQADPQFRETANAALTSANVLYRDIAEADPVTRETSYIGPISERKYRVNLGVDRVHDDAALVNMQELLEEVDQFLEQPDIDPLLERTWKFRRDYLRRWVVFPQYGSSIRNGYHTKYGTISTNPFEWVRMAFGATARGARTELAWMDLRAARETTRWFQLADFAVGQLRKLREDTKVGDAAISKGVLKAMRSHKWENDRIAYWNENVLNPILASHQTFGQLRLNVGSIVNGHVITQADMDVAMMEKQFSTRTLAVTQRGTSQTPLQFFNPIQIQSEFAGRKITRNALGPGRFTMARSLSEWADIFTQKWLATPTKQRIDLIRDGDHFRNAVWGYVMETNPEFTQKRSFEKYFDELAALSAEEMDYNFNSFDQLVEWLAERTTKDKMFDSMDVAREQIEATIVGDIHRHVTAYRDIKAEQNVAPETSAPPAAMQVASAASSFTRPRVRLVAPSTYFDYTLTEDTKRTAYLASVYQIYQLNQVHAFKDLHEALVRKQMDYEDQIRRLESKGMPRKRAMQEIQQLSMADVNAQKTRFNYKQLVHYIRTVEQMQKALSEMVIDQRSPHDGVVLSLLARVRSTLSSSLLANAQAIATNTMGGIVTTQFITMQHLGRASLALTPLKSAKEGGATIMKRLLSEIPANSAMGKALRSNIPGFRSIAEWLFEEQKKAMQQYHEAYQAGIVTPMDTRGRIQTSAELKETAGRIEFTEGPVMARWVNFLESLPGMRHALNHLRDKSPRLVDDTINISTMNDTRKNVFDKLKLETITAFQAREKLGKSNDFSNSNNLLQPGELGFRESSGFRDIEAHRTLFSSVGLMDNILLDYYTRWKNAAPEARNEVPLFSDPGAEASIRFELAAMGNMPTSGYTPLIMQGVGAKGIVKSLASMFMNFPARMAERLDIMAGRDIRDPKVRAQLHMYYGIAAVMMIIMLAGAFARELGQEGKRLITGRETTQLRLANVLADPTGDSIRRYIGIAMSSNVPYYGEMISRLLGNPAYGSVMDLTEMIPVAGMLKDVTIAGKRIVETGDVGYAGADFLNRWFPPASPVLRFLPELSGDVAARNASRALTAAAPKDMDLVRDRSSGGVYRQTPATIAVRTLMSEAYRGNEAGVRRAYERAIEERAALGSADPVQATRQSIAAQTPSRRVFGRQISRAEEERLLKRMSPSQRESYLAAREAFQLINQVIDAEFVLTKEPEAPRRNARTPRVLGSALPGMQSSRRRTPFGNLQIKGSRQRRRAPSFSFSD